MSLLDYWQIFEQWRIICIKTYERYINELSDNKCQNFMSQQMNSILRNMEINKCENGVLSVSVLDKHCNSTTYDNLKNGSLL